MRLAPVLVALSCAIVPLGCRGSPPPRAPSAPGDAAPVAPVAVSDAAFSVSAQQVLSAGERTPQRTNLLAGVVRRQLVRAASRFETGGSAAGLAALTGAFYLVREGELHPSMLEGGQVALREGAHEVARQGDEGRARALYGMLRGLLPAGPERDDIDGHLRALAEWRSERSDRMSALGAEQRAAVARSLLDPQGEIVAGARDATVRWLRGAARYEQDGAPVRTPDERDDAIEAYRALRAGGASLVALHLRHGDAAAAAQALETAGLAGSVPPGLLDRLARAGADDPRAWVDLFRLFDAATHPETPETSMEPELARAAAWGAALELHRSAPNDFRAAAPLAALLPSLGLAEAAPLVLANALGPQTTAEELAFALALVLDAMVNEDAIGQLDAARRTYSAALRLLEAARENSRVGAVRPSAARVTYAMGALETRAGELARALPLVEDAVRREPTAEGYQLLSGIQRQRGDFAGARRSLELVIQMSRRGGDAPGEAEAWLVLFEVAREAGQPPDAASALAMALARALDARQLARSGAEQARAERLLARVLDAYGERSGAARATERALTASAGDARQLTATLLDASRRALAARDLEAARAMLRRAREAGLAAEDLVYVALWLRLVEVASGAPPDGAVDDALASIQDATGWPAKLAAWGRGRATDAELSAGARTLVERTEAAFYVALHLPSSPWPAVAALEPVARSTAIDLVEVMVARDLILRAKGAQIPRLPAGTALP
ncbi:MAG: hypothetical protein IT376_22480 [Polyangiaceae bacterium]|nr:hypothetical protein [Polyangiaceae bacterium]